MARLRPVGDWIAGRFEVFAVHPGGMGVVYVAHDHLGPPGRSVVAIKTLRDEWLDVDMWKARFIAEGQLWVNLGSHPNIVHASSVEDFEGRPHILLELVTGGDLRKKIGTPELDTLKAIHFGVQFCLGMEHANRQGLYCHRDVKPGNLMIAEDGTLKITDFGLAVIRDESQGEPGRAIALDAFTPNGPSLDDPDHRLTQTGSLMGTLPYMAPEQFRDSKAVDVRADIYAFGVVLFEMLTAELPFHGRTIARLDRAHSNYAPPSVVPAIPKKHAREAEAIDEIVQRCLMKEPAGRFASMEELRRALTRTLQRLDPAHDPKR